MRRSLAVTTPAMDLLLTGGLSVLVLVPLIFSGFGFDQERLNEQLLSASALLNPPHFAASFVLLYGSREQARQHRFGSLTFPLLLLAIGVGVVVAAARSDVPVLVVAPENPSTDDDKFYLSRTPLKYVPLTPLQASRVNALVGEHEDPAPLLAPAQRALLARIRARPDAGWEDAIGVELGAAWKRAALHDTDPSAR